MTDFTTFVHKQNRYERALAEANAKNKDVLFGALAETGITSVIVQFDGEGDSGQIESVIAYAGATVMELPAATVAVLQVGWHEAEAQIAESSLHEAVSDLCYDYLSQEHGGWENNDGAFGTFTFDVAARTIELEFSARFCDFHTTTHNV